MLECSSEAFGEKADGTPAPNIEKMEAKIGRLTLENDFLESALIKAGSVDFRIVVVNYAAIVFMLGSF